jgi:hypothetical protein
MTKKEKDDLITQINNNDRVIKEVEEGTLWGNIYKTKEMRLAFIQGLSYANERLKEFIEI